MHETATANTEISMRKLALALLTASGPVMVSSMPAGAGRNRADRSGTAGTCSINART